MTSMMHNTLTVACFNYGVELEHMGEYEQALAAYQKAHGFSKSYEVSNLETFIADAVKKMQDKVKGFGDNL